MLDVLSEAAMRTIVLASAAQCALSLLRIRHAQLLLAAWTIVMAASLAMPFIQQMTPLRVTLSPVFQTSSIDVTSDLLPGPLLKTPADPVFGEAALQAWPVSWSEAVYLAVCAGLLVRVGLGVVLSLRILSRAMPVRPEWAHRSRVRISRDVTGPVTILNVILLPIAALNWTAATRQAVMAHERAHVTRWDFAMLIASQLNRGLFWFSPVSWWLHRRLVALSELASDDQAMATFQDRLGYAEILLEMGRRSGPVYRGLAMARPATLPYRIDRILRDQVPRRPAARSWGVSIALGMTSLSLGAASTISNPIAPPTNETLSMPWELPREQPHREAGIGIDAGPEDMVPQGPVRDAASTTAPLQRGAGTVAEAPTSSVTRPESDPVVSAVIQPGSSPWQQGRRSSQTMPGIPPAVTPSRPNLRPTQGNGTRGTPNDRAGIQVPVLKEIAAQRTRGTEIPLSIRAVDDATLSQLSLSVAFRPAISALPLEFQGIIGTACSGTVAVGLGAQSSPEKQPYVVAGQLVSARAQFYIKSDGTPWVRFKAFGEQPLDLPLRFTRNGMTWTGEYGIAYTVQASGRNRLTGLAAFFRNESAKLDFNCVEASLDLL